MPPRRVQKFHRGVSSCRLSCRGVAADGNQPIDLSGSPEVFLVPSLKATMTFPSRTFMLFSASSAVGDLCSGECSDGSSGSRVGIPNIGTAPIKVFQASLQSADGSPGPDGRTIIAYTPPFSVSGRSEISVAAKPLNQGDGSTPKTVVLRASAWPLRIPIIEM